MILNAQEIIKILTEKYTLEDLGYEEIDHLDSELGEIKIVDSYGGEGMGSDYWTVYYFVEHNIYLKMSGYYQSYSGASFDENPYEVKPVEKVVTVFESI